MELSTKSCYDTHALIDIALHSDVGPSLLKDITERQAVLHEYLDHILSSLGKNGLVRNIRERGG